MCKRFALSDEPRQWRDIAFCLTIVKWNSERAFKKLVECLPYYQDKLHEKTVFGYFEEVLKLVRALLCTTSA